MSVPERPGCIVLKPVYRDGKLVGFRRVTDDELAADTTPRRPSKYPLPPAVRQQLWEQTWARLFAAIEADLRARASAERTDPPPPAPKRRRRRPSPSRLAKWEQHWQQAEPEAER
jgi:hypothetical protein